MKATAACALLGLATTALGQQAGSVTAEAHPEFTIQDCTKAAGCQDVQGSVTMDMQWRWMHDKNGYKNCQGEGGLWDATLCPDPETCSKSCALDGCDAPKYSQTYGIEAIAGGVKLAYKSPKGVYSSRVYLLEDENNYRLFKLKNREFSFTTDVSSLPCGMNGALYFVEMPKNGGLDGNVNTAGAKYGTGYCDAQCPQGMKFVNSLANLGEEYAYVKNPELKEVKVGPMGKHGACCAEMDIFEANREAASYTAHPCDNPGLFVCEGEAQCGNKDKGFFSSCDKDGCGFNSYQLGQPDFYGNGAGFQVDSSKPMTIVTQFITTDGTDYGDLAEIRRVFIQDGKVINQEPATNVNGGGDSITDNFCNAVAKEFNNTKPGKPDSYTFPKRGGLKSMGEALERGMVLTMSIWDDSLFRMLWLDGEKNAADLDEAKPGVARGACPFESGNTKELKKNHADAYVKYTNVRVGEIGSTYSEVLLAAKYSKEQVVEATRHSLLTSPASTLFVGLVAVALVVLGALRTTKFRHFARRIPDDARLLTTGITSPEEGLESIIE